MNRYRIALVAWNVLWAIPALVVAFMLGGLVGLFIYFAWVSGQVIGFLTVIVGVLVAVFVGAIVLSLLIDFSDWLHFKANSL